MKILAFLQNQWFENPAKVRAIIERNGPAARRRFIAWGLFGTGCVTGRRLQAAFGEELCDQIVWENASPQIGDRASAAFPPDLEHIAATITSEQPNMILAFGQAATHGVLRVLAEWGNHKGPEIIILGGPHPASRQRGVVGRLKSIADDTRAALEVQP